MTIRQLMEQLTAEQLLAADKQDEIESILANNETKGESSTPWYIRVLMGLAAWFAASFMLSFVLVSFYFYSSSSFYFYFSVFPILYSRIFIFSVKSLFAYFKDNPTSCCFFSFFSLLFAYS